MTDQELYKALLDDSDNSDMLSDLRQKLENELEKSDSELDVDAINELTLAIDRILGDEQLTEEKSKQGIEILKQEIHIKNRKCIFHKVKWVAVCACIMLFISNIWSYSAYGINSFSAAYQLINGGITIDFKIKDTEPYYDNPYKDEMRESCKNNGIDALLPSYLPEGFVPTDHNGVHDADDISNTLLFYFKLGKSKINFSIINFISEECVMPYGIPSDSHSISQQQINGITVHIQKEDKKYWAAFQIGLTQYIFYADNVDYDECQRVLNSMFDSNN